MFAILLPICSAFNFKVIAGVAELHDTLKVEVEFLKKSSFCGFRVKKK